MWTAIAGVPFLLPDVAAAQSEVVEYYATDAVGSIRAVFNAAGNVTGRSDYLPFGEEFEGTGTLPAARFTGQDRDPEAGLDYFKARAMAARTGRFMPGVGRLRPPLPR